MHLFREETLHRLPVEKLFSLYNDLKKRPTKELYAMLGVVLLQQMKDLTDEAAVRFQYRVALRASSDFSCYLAPRTVRAMREQLGRLGLERALFENVTL